MKNIIKKNLPFVFNLFKKIYLSSFFYKNKQKKIIAEKSNWLIQQKKFHSKIVSEVFNNNFVIHNGPFKGMKYIDVSSGSAFLPKILGSYEEPIQDWILQIINRNYKSVIDIGCAEGYYAVGFGIKMPNTEILAYDTDVEARKNIKELIRINNLKNVRVMSECTHDELNRMSKINTLVFCDVEGYELVLLNPIEVPNLKYTDLLIESHDFLNQHMTETLINRFYKTHTIKIVVDYPFRKNQYQTPTECTREILNLITDESRPPSMKFLYLESMDGKL